MFRLHSVELPHDIIVSSLPAHCGWSKLGELFKKGTCKRQDFLRILEQNEIRLSSLWAKIKATGLPNNELRNYIILQSRLLLRLVSFVTLVKMFRTLSP